MKQFKIIGINQAAKKIQSRKFLSKVSVEEEAANINKKINEGSAWIINSCIVADSLKYTKLLEILSSKKYSIAIINI